MKAFYGDLKLGILGGGQLGRMLIQQAINYNVTVKVLDPDREAPCRKLCDEFVVGSLGDYETVYKFGKKVDLLTIEIEKVNVDALEQLEKEGVMVYPQPRIIRLIQDKGLQKQFFKENDIPFFLTEVSSVLNTFSKFLCILSFTILMSTLYCNSFSIEVTCLFSIPQGIILLK